MVLGESFIHNKLRYQLIISLPQNKAINVPLTRKGPKGTLLVKLFLAKATKPNPIIAPIKNEKNKPTKILGKPRKRPIKKPNLASPKPIHLPRDKNQIRKKNPEAARALRIEE